MFQSARFTVFVSNCFTNPISDMKFLFLYTLMLCFITNHAHASSDQGNTVIFGTLSNFDIYNTTPEPSEGFEIELEDVHMSDLYRTFPSHYLVEDISEYSDGTGSGVRILYHDYYFRESDGTEHFTLNPTLNPVSTNGHQAVNKVDFEHFGFSLRGAQPTATRTYWLDKLPNGQYERINTDPLPVPIPTFNYAPGVDGRQPNIRVELEVPEPPEVPDQKPDSIWMKIYKTEIDRDVELGELMSGPGIVPQGNDEMEIEWEVLEGGKGRVKDDDVDEEEDPEDEDNDGHAVLIRYEYFKYTGPVDDENEPTTPYLEDQSIDPVTLGHVGDFIAANMVAANIGFKGDFDINFEMDELDINMLFAAINDSNNAVFYDLTDDDLVNNDDLNTMISEILETQFGDANLDGTINIGDLAKLASNYGQDVNDWSKGDFNNDGHINISDLAILASNFGFGNAEPQAAQAIPEPSSFLLLLCSSILFQTRRNHN